MAIDPNSSAYLAGQAHGAALSNNSSPSQLPPVDLPAVPTYSIPDFPSSSGMMSSANAEANKVIAAQVAQIIAQSQDQARQINLAAAAAAKSTEGIGDATAASYRQSANDLVGFAHGLSGQLGQTAASEAERVQQALGAAGQPGQANTGQGGYLQNVLFGTGGLIPANNLVSSGNAFAAAQRQIPAGILGYGQNLGFGALGAGVQAANAARAKQGELAHQYFADKVAAESAKSEAAYRKGELSLAEYRAKVDLATAQATSNYHQALLDAGYRRDQVKAALDLFRADLTQQGITERNRHNVAVEGIAAANASKPKVWGSGTSGIYAYDPTTGKTTEIKAPRPQQPKNKQVIGSDKSGRVILNPDGTTTVVQPPVKDNKTTGGLSPSSWGVQVRAATKLVKDLGRVEAPKSHYLTGKPDPVAVPGTGHKPQPYRDVVEQTIALGQNNKAWIRKAIQIVNANPAYNTMGKNGRPYVGAAAKQKALQVGRSALKKGYSYESSLSAGLESGLFPPDILEAALKQVYFGHVTARLGAYGGN